MRRVYDELMRLMEQDLGAERDLFWRCLHAAPEKFWEPQVDIYETRDALKIKVELSGVRKDDIHLELSGDGREVTLRGIRLDLDADCSERIVFHQMEIYTGPFERTLVLPPTAAVDRSSVEAVYLNGFLVITLPKRTPPRPARTHIRVQQ